MPLKKSSSRGPPSSASGCGSRNTVRRTACPDGVSAPNAPLPGGSKVVVDGLERRDRVQQPLPGQVAGVDGGPQRVADGVAPDPARGVGVVRLNVVEGVAHRSAPGGAVRERAPGPHPDQQRPDRLGLGTLEQRVAPPRARGDHDAVEAPVDGLPHDRAGLCRRRREHDEVGVGVDHLRDGAGLHFCAAPRGDVDERHVVVLGRGTCAARHVPAVVVGEVERHHRPDVVAAKHGVVDRVHPLDTGGATRLDDDVGEQPPRRPRGGGGDHVVGDEVVDDRRGVAAPEVWASATTSSRISSYRPPATGLDRSGPPPAPAPHGRVPGRPGVPIARTSAGAAWYAGFRDGGISRSAPDARSTR